MLADLEPEELIGVDISESQVKRAIQVYANNPNPYYAKMKFYAKNCQEPLNLGQFDVVFSVHLLNYAYEKPDLLEFYSNMYEATKPGGICCGLINSPFITAEELNAPDRHIKYGIKYYRHADNIHQDVDFFYEGKHLFGVKGCVWPGEYHEECALKVGFTKIEWIKPSLDETHDDQEGYFDIYLKYNPTIFFKAYK
eukprot:TRINITY_DN1128_c0_g1_i1.p1 TRINITY_DN1128_c0_g1~~TRINITY_DN1128_c0_g1_i1.p1  ORF type:complete len:196 (-),score=0.72 TRINITY_DN1128_c0_g1_i1:75-662(-)